jgi:beta-galactosidase/beta-glucuronidase
MVRQEWLSLNGQWDYAITHRDKINTPAFAGRIVVPFSVESSLSGVRQVLTEQQRLWYHRKFNVPPKWHGQRVLLRFDAVDWEARVWVNDKELGTHQGGYDPFSFDITDTLKPGGEQEVVVSVFDPTSSGYQPRGKQKLGKGEGFHSPCSGIWQTVWLEPVGAISVESLRLVPDVGARILNVTVNASEATNLVGVEAVALDGRTEVGRVNGATGQTIKLPVRNAKLWSPSAPFLYDLRITLKRENRKLDEVTSYFGMRAISVGLGKAGLPVLILNDQPLFELGILDQGYWPDGLYTAPTDEALRSDIEAMKQLGFNLCHKWGKIEPERWYYWCDKLGLLVWQDMPGGDRAPSSSRSEIQRRPESASQFEGELVRMVEGRGNHPSIVMWVPFNEHQGQYDTIRILSCVKGLDPSRLVLNTGGPPEAMVGDVQGHRLFPGPAGAVEYGGSWAHILNRAGGFDVPVAGHIWTTSPSRNVRRNYFPTQATQEYKALMRRMRVLETKYGLSGVVVSQFTDVETETDGLLTYDRLLKLDAKEITGANKLVLEAASRP